jgi:UDP-N-acetylmuramyl pentapeptide phosphotransferase/UDP-N-acetylglucosamine-1-phosphate transferase
VLGSVDTQACLIGASVVALLGFVDDVRPLPALVRLIVQVAVATLVLTIVLRDRTFAVSLASRMQVVLGAAVPLSVVFVVGTTNIYNFMDGMDGLAATQTMSAGLALGVCAGAAGQGDLALIAFVLVAATAGFFVHNAPPATLFLGDAGSTFLGFTFSALALVAATRPAPVPLGVVPMALAPFLLDGTFTILRRAMRGERVWRPHKTHLYQRAVASGLAHREVLVVYAGWSAVAAAGGMLAARCTALGELAMAIAMLVPFSFVWMWVVRREARSTLPSK